MATKKNTPSWSDVKTKLTDFDRAGLLALVQDLYAASKDNQAFLNARLSLGDDPLKPYMATIERWLRPDVYKNQTYSVSKAKKAIADYKKAVGRSEGLVELMVFFCEQALAFSNDVGVDDEGYYDALVRVFEQVLKLVTSMPEPQRESFLDQLEDIRADGQGLGWGVGDDFNAMWLDAGLELDE